MRIVFSPGCGSRKTGCFYDSGKLRLLLGMRNMDGEGAFHSYSSKVV